MAKWMRSRFHLSSVAIPGHGTHDVLFVATEHDSVYAIDAVTGAVLWHASLLGAGETTSDAPQLLAGHARDRHHVDAGHRQVARPNGVIYVVAMSKNASGAYFQRLHALDITAGAELFGGPQTVQASFPGTGAGSSNGIVTFDPKQYEERAGLLLLNGQIITTWTSHCDIDPYTGWIMCVQRRRRWRRRACSTSRPTARAARIWMAGAGPGGRRAGQRLPARRQRHVRHDARRRRVSEHRQFRQRVSQDLDDGRAVGRRLFRDVRHRVGSRTPTAISARAARWCCPTSSTRRAATRHLAVGAGKDAHIYVVDRDSMGKWNASSNQNYQDITGALSAARVLDARVLQQHAVLRRRGRQLKAFSDRERPLSSDVRVSTARGSFAYPGTTPAISASGTANGDRLGRREQESGRAARVRRDATCRTSSTTRPRPPSGRDAFGTGNKFITPTIVNGRVYVGTTNGVAVFGTLGPSAPTGLKMHRPVSHALPPRPGAREIGVKLKVRSSQRNGPVAQLGARMNGIHEVTGSIPVWSTILRSPSASFGSVNQAVSRREGCRAVAAKPPRRAPSTLLVLQRLQILDEVPLRLLTEIEIEYLVVVFDDGAQGGESTVVVEAALLPVNRPANGVVRYRDPASDWTESRRCRFRRRCACSSPAR